MFTCSTEGERREWRGDRSQGGMEGGQVGVTRGILRSLCVQEVLLDLEKGVRVPTLKESCLLVKEPLRRGYWADSPRGWDRTVMRKL